MCAWYAFKTRNVPANFNEAKFIGFTMYTTLVIWIAFVVIYFSSNNKTTTLCLCISLSSLFALLLLFFPKCYIILLKPEQNNRSFFTTTTSDIRCHIGYGASPPALTVANNTNAISNNKKSNKHNQRLASSADVSAPAPASASAIAARRSFHALPGACFSISAPEKPTSIIARTKFLPTNTNRVNTISDASFVDNDNVNTNATAVGFSRLGGNIAAGKFR